MQEYKIKHPLGDVKICPNCGGVVKVYDSRNYKTGLRRNRMCMICGYRYATVEIALEEYAKIDRMKNMLESVKILFNSITEGGDIDEVG